MYKILFCECLFYILIVHACVRLSATNADAVLQRVVQFKLVLELLVRRLSLTADGYVVVLVSECH